jgi:Glycosyltransferase family 87
MRADLRSAARAVLVCAPIFLAACVVPDGGLFRAERYRDVHIYERYARELLDGSVPYRDFFVDWPPGAFAVFLPPAAVSGHYNAAFKVLMALCGVATLVAVALALVELGASRAHQYAAVAAVALSPLALGPISLNTYDAWPALLVIAALALLLAGRDGWAFGLLGLAFVAKLYPLVLLPPAAIYVWRRAGARAAGRAIVVFLAVTIVVLAPFVAVAPDGVWSSFRAQAERSLQVESAGASVLLAADRLDLYHAHIVRASGGIASRDLDGSLPDAVSALTVALEAAAVIAVWLVFAWRRGRRDLLPLAFAGAVAGFIAFTKVLSPQYLVWLVPLVPLLAGWLGLAASALVGVALVLAQIWFFHYRDVFRVEGIVWLVLVRDVLLVVLYGVLVAALLRWKTSTPSSSNTSRQSGLRRSWASRRAPLNSSNLPP